MALAGPARRPLLLPLLTAATLLGCGAPKTRKMPGQDEAPDPPPIAEAPSMWDRQPGAAPPVLDPPSTATDLVEGQRILGTPAYYVQASRLYAHPQGHVLYAIQSNAILEIDPSTGTTVSNNDIGYVVDDLVFIDPGHAVVAWRDSKKVVFVSLLDLDTMRVLDERELDVVIRAGQPRLSSDGTLLATTAGEIPTRLWSVKSGKRLKSYGGKSFDHDGALAIALRGGESRVLGRTFRGSELYGESLSEPIAEFEFAAAHTTPDGERILGIDGVEVQLVAAADGRKLERYDLGLDHRRADALSPSGSKYAMVTDKGDAAVLDLKSGQVTSLALPRVGLVSDLAFVGEDRLASHDYTGALFITSIADPKQTLGPMGHGSAIRWVRFLGDDRLLSFGADARYRLWNTSTGASLGIVGEEVIAVEPAGQWFATGNPASPEARDRDGQLLESPPPLASLLHEDDEHRRREGPMRPRWWANGSKATVLGAHDVHVRDLNGEVAQTWSFVGDHTFEALPGIIDPSGEHAAIWDQDGALMLVDAKRGKATERVGLGACKVPQLAVFVDYGKGLRFVALEHEGTFAEYDARNGKLLRSGSLELVTGLNPTLRRTPQVIRATTDGMVYFTLTGDGLYRLDLKGDTITRLRSAADAGHDWAGLDISPSGTQVALGRWSDGTVELWDRAKLDALPGATADLSFDEQGREVCELPEPEPEPEPLEDF